MKLPFGIRLIFFLIALSVFNVFMNSLNHHEQAASGNNTGARRSKSLALYEGIANTPANYFAEPLIHEIHRRYNVKTHPNIYMEASDYMKAKYTEDEFVDLMIEAREELGAIESSDNLSCYQTHTRQPMTTYLICSQKTRFQSLEANEEFIFEFADGELRLNNYLIQQSKPNIYFEF